MSFINFLIILVSVFLIPCHCYCTKLNEVRIFSISVYLRMPVITTDYLIWISYQMFLWLSCDFFHRIHCMPFASFTEKSFYGCKKQWSSQDFYLKGGGGDSNIFYKYSNKIARNHDLRKAEWNPNLSSFPDQIRKCN